MEMRTKKGASLLFQNVIYIIFTILIILALIWYTNNVTKKEDFQKQAIAKQMSLLIDASEPGTSIDLKHANVSVTKKDSAITAKAQLEFSYGFFTDYNIDLMSKDGETKIGVQS